MGLQYGTVVVEVGGDVNNNSLLFHGVLGSVLGEQEGTYGVDHEDGSEGIGGELVKGTEKVSSCSIDEDMYLSVFLYNIFDCLLDFSLFSDIARAAPYIFVAGLFGQRFDCFVNVLYFSADYVDRCAVIQKLFGYFVADAGCSTTDECEFSLEEGWVED